MNKLFEISKAYGAGLVSKKAYIRRMHKRHRHLWEYSEFIRNKNLERIVIGPQDVRIKTKSGVELICDPQDERHMFMEVLNFGDYEAEERSMMSRLLKKNSTVIDIGANIGWYAVHLASVVSRGRVIAFEPIPRTCGYLKKNIALNGSKNIFVHQVGLSNKKGRFNFYYDRGCTVATSLRNITRRKNAALVKCRVETLDHFLSEHLIRRIDFIKCDVEGAEKFVIEGGLKTIQSNKPVIFLELLRKWSAKFSYHPNDVIGLLAEIGYACYAVAGKRLRRVREIRASERSTNFYFLHKTKHARLLNQLAG